MRVLGISGSLRRDSLNTALLRAAAELAPPEVELELFDGLRDLPPFDQDLDAPGALPAVDALREAIAGADALLIATPEYNGSIPGGLKNAVDWASRPKSDAALAGVPVAVIGATTGQFGGVWAQDDLRRVLGIAGARVVDATLAVPRAHERIEDGRVDSESLRRALADVVHALAAAASHPTAAVAA
jgi:chromate reductase